MTTTNGGPTQPVPQGQPGADQQPPQLNVLAQYIKDFSFENPNAPRSLQQGQPQPQIEIQINVNVGPMAETEFEVVLKIEGKASTPNGVMFSFDLEYGGVFRVLNVPQESLLPLVMIECPRLLFPFPREIIAMGRTSEGWPPLLLYRVDFVGLCSQKMMEQQRPANAQPA